MKKYRVFLSGWDFDTGQIIEAESASKAKGLYIKGNLKEFLQAYPKTMFFRGLRSNLV